MRTSDAKIGPQADEWRPLLNENMVLTDNHRTRSAGHAMLVLQQAQAEVRKLIAGPNVFICDECVQVCTEIIAREDESTPTATATGSVVS